MTLSKVSSGQPLRIPAEAYNAFVDAAEAFKSQRLQQQAGAAGAPLPSGIVLVRNDSPESQDRFAVLGLAGPLIAPADHLDAFQEQVSFSAVNPDQDAHANRFCLLQEPIAAGAIGRALIAGVMPVQLTVNAEDDWMAAVVTDQTESLTTGSDGGARILWKEAGTGLRWGIVQIPAGGAGGSEPNLVLPVTAPNHGWLVGDALAWSGTGWDLADAGTIGPTDLIGIVGRIPDADTALIVLWGLLCLDGLDPHTDYWLDPLVPGGTTAVKPAEHPRLVFHHAQNRLCVVRAGTGSDGGGTGAERFADLTDVDLGTGGPGNGQAALWNAVAQRWTPRDVVLADPVPPLRILAGPTAGNDAKPEFRNLTLEDLPDVPGTSVLVNITGGPAAPIALPAQADDRALLRVAGTLQWLQIPTGIIADEAVTDPKIASVGWGKLTGVPAAFPPAPHDHHLGGDLTGNLADAQIAAAAVGTEEIADGAVTLPKLAPIPGPAVLGSPAGGTAPEPIAAAADGGVLQRSGGIVGFARITDLHIADGAGIAWAKIDTTGALPSDIGAAAVDHRHALVDLEDVAVAGLTTGHILVYDAGTGLWHNADQTTGTGVMPATSVWANSSPQAQNGAPFVAPVDNRVLLRAGGVLQWLALPRTAMADGAACSVIGRSAATPGPLADVAATVDDAVLIRVTGTLTWVATIARMKFGGSATGLIQYIAAGGQVTHEYDPTTGIQAWKQRPTGRMRFYWGNDYWEIAAAGSTVDIVAWVGGVAKHRLSLDVSVSLGGAARTLTLREIDVCDAGVAKKMAILASDPY